VVAGFPAGLDGALLFILEEFNQFGDGGFFDAKAFLTGVLSDLRRLVTQHARHSA